MTDDIQTWFSSWDRLWSVGQSAAFFFVFIILVVRVLGKRVTAQMNNFDWIITVAVGSLAASGVLLKNVSIADAAVAIAVIGALQWGATWATMRFDGFARILKPSPRLLVHKGEILHGALKRERVTPHEVAAALRAQGYTDLADANWVILETNGEMTVIPRQAEGLRRADLLQDVEGPDRRAA